MRTIWSTLAPPSEAYTLHFRFLLRIVLFMAVSGQFYGQYSKMMVSQPGCIKSHFSRNTGYDYHLHCDGALLFHRSRIKTTTQNAARILRWSFKSSIERAQEATQAQSPQWGGSDHERCVAWHPVGWARNPACAIGRRSFKCAGEAWSCHVAQYLWANNEPPYDDIALIKLRSSWEMNVC